MESPNRLEVVREHVGRGHDHGRDVAFAAFEVGGQDLDAAARDRSADGSDRPRPDAGPSVR